MNNIEDKIKECVNYEIKTTSDDILRKFEMKKRISTHRFNFKIAFASLGVAFAIFIVVFSGIKINNKNSNEIDNNNSGLIINEFVELSDAQKIECSKIACEMAPAVSLIKNVGFSKTEFYSVENDARDKFDIVKNSLIDIYYNDYNELKLKQINYKYNDLVYVNELIIDSESSLYFEKNIFDELSSSNESKGLLKIDNNYYKISKKDSRVTIFLNPDDINDKITISTENDIYSYVVSRNKAQILNVNFKKINDYISVYLTCRSGEDEDGIKYSYKVYKRENSYFIEYENRDSKKDNGFFEI